MRFFETTIDALIPEWPPLDPLKRAFLRDYCACFVRRQIALAPAHIRVGIVCLFTIFRVFVLLRLGPLARGTKPRATRAAALSDFSTRGPSIFAGLERVLRSMTLLAFLEHPSVLSAIGEGSLADQPGALRGQGSARAETAAP